MLLRFARAHKSDRCMLVSTPANHRLHEAMETSGFLVARLALDVAPGKISGQIGFIMEPPPR